MLEVCKFLLLMLLLLLMIMMMILVGKVRISNPSFLPPPSSQHAHSDTAGQLHLYTAGEPRPECRRWPYDQFWSSDYAPCTNDVAHWVLDTERQVPPHLVTSHVLVDVTESAYGDEVRHIGTQLQDTRTNCLYSPYRLYSPFACASLHLVCGYAGRCLPRYSKGVQANASTALCMGHRQSA